MPMPAPGPAMAVLVRADPPRVMPGNVTRSRFLGVVVPVVGANDVGRTSLLRILHMLLGASTAQIFQALTSGDLRDPDRQMDPAPRPWTSAPLQ